jgi:hypothetical protein
VDLINDEDVAGVLLRVVASGEEEEGVFLPSLYRNSMGRERVGFCAIMGRWWAGLVGCFGGLVSLSLFSLYSFCFIISRFLVLI